MTATTIVKTRENPGCLIQLLWFAFIGVWLGQVWMVVAWFFMVTIIGIPLGVMMLNNLPRVIALREPTRQVKVTTHSDGKLEKQVVQSQQVNIILRAIYFILVGWWASAIWMEVAFVLCSTIIGLPVGFWMFDRVPAVLSLHRS